MAKILGVLALLVALNGCLLDRIGSGKNIKDFDRTAGGWYVEWEDHGTGHTKQEAYDIFDAAMIRAGAAFSEKYGLPAGEYRHRIRKAEIGFTLVDAEHFVAYGYAIDNPKAVFATGETQGPWVKLAFYNVVSDSDPVEIPGAQYPALEYETFVNILGMTW